MVVGITIKPRAPHSYFLNGRKEVWGYHSLEVFDAAQHSRPIIRIAYPFLVQQSLSDMRLPGIDAAPEGMRL